MCGRPTVADDPTTVVDDPTTADDDPAATAFCHTPGADAAVDGVAVADDGRAHASLHASCPEWSTDATDARDAPDAPGARPSDSGCST
jgi:hypothetical protein